MNRRDMLCGVGAATVAASQFGDDAVAAPAAKSGDLWRWSATDIAAAVRSRHVSAREVTLSCLSRMEAVNSRINAIVDSTPEEALANADMVDKAVRSGAELGPLIGVPITTKIMTDQRGHATSNGSVALKNNIAKEDSTSVNNLRQAGVELFGRTNSATFGTRWYTENDLFGQTLNPWNPTVTPGGSSGGAAGSVATGITPIAQSTDGMGSTRIPAYACGVAGIRPSFGRVAGVNPGVMARPRAISTALFDTDGLMARHVKDLRLGLGVTARGDMRDPWWVPVRTFPKPVGPIRVALFDQTEGFTPDPDVATGLATAAAALSKAGYIVERAVPPFFAEITPLLFSMIFNENREHRGEQIAQYGDDKAKKAMAFFSAMTPTLDLVGFSNAFGRREQILVAWKKFLQAYPLILMPPCWARQFPLGFDLQGSAQFASVIHALTPTFVASLLGLPALAVPAGVIGGLPTGVEIVGDQFREDMCFDAGEIVEAAVNMPTPIDPRVA